MLSYPRRIILSRKGFDSAAGGCASPILDGKLISLPIPETDCSVAPCSAGHVTYRQLGKAKGDPSIAGLVSELTGGKVSPDRCVHLDPDIRPELRRSHHRKSSGNSMLFGQVGSAQSELRTVESGDLFLFFGWFREAERTGSGFRFRPGLRDQHHLWGWLQVSEVLRLDQAAKAGALSLRHSHHPHVSHARYRRNNTLYEATQHLSFAPQLAGAGTFQQANSRTCLTAPEARSRSEWLLPSFFRETGMTRFNFSSEFWKRQGQTIRSIAPRCKGCGAASYGQEFVFEAARSRQRVHAWLRTLFPFA